MGGWRVRWSNATWCSHGRTACWICTIHITILCSLTNTVVTPLQGWAPTARPGVGVALVLILVVWGELGVSRACDLRSFPQASEVGPRDAAAASVRGGVRPRGGAPRGLSRAVGRGLKEVNENPKLNEQQGNTFPFHLRCPKMSQGLLGIFWTDSQLRRFPFQRLLMRKENSQ